MPLGISGTFNFMLVFQAEHNILMHPFHMLGVAAVFGGSLFLRHARFSGDLLLWCVKTTETESQNYGYKFGQEEENLQHRCSPWLLRVVSSSNMPASTTAAPSLLPGCLACNWHCHRPGHQHHAFNLNGFNFKPVDSGSQGRVIGTWADVINRRQPVYGSHARAQRSQLPLDLATAEAPEIIG